MQEDNAWSPEDNSSDMEELLRASNRLVFLIAVSLGCVVVLIILHFGLSLGWFKSDYQGKEVSVPNRSAITWQPPDLSALGKNEVAQLVRYGRELIVHTAVYLGPKGKVAKISNGLNCQNCHLAAGTKPFAANFSAVAGSYPKFRKRSGTIEGFVERVNGCFERSMNGVPLAADSREMKAIVAYLKWIGINVTDKSGRTGAGLVEISQLSRPADPVKGNALYLKFCAQCHGASGQGQISEDGIEWKYPPLWGVNSFNTGAGLYRLSKFAAFIKANMPFGVTFENPLLTDEQAWDIAAYVNSMPRPHRSFPKDWPVLAWKPVDHPFGPYADSYSEVEHKYGPFGHMRADRKN